MSDNKALWNRVCITDPKAVKPITGKQYQGNSPKPYWIVERLTDEFGPCGIGWGFSVLNERFERFSDTDTLHVALVDFWYVLGEKTGHLQQVGQTKASYMTGAGKFMLDEDAPKKSVTDALVKCASYIGFAGDIFSGRWDDSKYVAEARKHYAEQPSDSLVPVLQASIEQAKAKRSGVVADVLSTMPPADPAEAEYIAELAENVKDLFPDKGVATAFDRIEAGGLDNDQKIRLWNLLPSNIRSALKKEGEARRVPA